LFEVGTVFTTGTNPETSAPAERIHAAAVVAGDRHPAHFTEPHPPQFDEWDAKGIAELLATAAYPGAKIECAPSVGDALWTIVIDGVAAGSVVRLALDAPVWASPAFGVEVDLQAVSSDAPRSSTYAAIPTMPAIEVDLALLVPESTAAATGAETIRDSAGDMLESLVVFDEFRGTGIPEGQRSLGWRLTFRHPERTLRDKEIQGRTAKILSVLESKLGIRQRSS
jgi:phenylalanyl-tRNA synthetase beta chain